METRGFGDGEGMSEVQEELVENRRLGGKKWGAKSGAEQMGTGAFGALKAAGHMELSCQFKHQSKRGTDQQAMQCYDYEVVRQEDFLHGHVAGEFLYTVYVIP